MEIMDKKKPKFKLAESAPELIRSVLLSRRWIEVLDVEGGIIEENRDEDASVNLLWKNNRFRKSGYEMAEASKGLQRLNHFRGSGSITRKDDLLRHLRLLKSTHGEIFDICPKGFILPMEYNKFVKEYSSQSTKSIWICKPTDLSRGRKIYLLRDLSELTYDQAVIIQQYVERPLTIGGYKHDLRVYCLVNKIHPLQAFIYDEGIVRFSTQKYSFENGDVDIKNLFSHLTNSSINKYSPTLNSEKDEIGAGCKWTFKRYRQWFEEKSTVSFNSVWAKIVSIVRSTLVILLTTVDYNSSSFELFGFDIMLSDDYRPWLLEVNCSPALGVDCEVDRLVKIPLLNETFDIVGIEKAVQEDEGTNNISNSNNDDTNPKKPSLLNSAISIIKKKKSRVSSLPTGNNKGCKVNRMLLTDIPNRVGNFTRIMPVSQTALDANVQLINLQKEAENGKKSPLLEQNCLKLIIKEVKSYHQREFVSASTSASVHPIISKPLSSTVPRISSYHSSKSQINDGLLVLRNTPVDVPERCSKTNDKTEFEDDSISNLIKVKTRFRSVDKIRQSLENIKMSL